MKQPLNLFGLAVLMLSLMSIGGCKHYVTTVKPNSPPEPGTNEGPTKREFLKSTYRFTARECPDLFPETEIREFPLTVFADQQSSNGELVLDVAMNCHYDLQFFDECCECLASIDYIQFDDPALEGTTVNFSFSSNLAPLQAPISYTIEGGKVNFNPSITKFIKHGMKFYLSHPTETLDADQITTGGLVIIQNVDGGG